MEITSLHFLIFVVVILVIYHQLPHRAQNIWLLIASYVFYVFWSWKLALLLLGVTILHFELAKHLRKDRQVNTSLLWVGIGADVILFLIFKASSFYFYRLVALLDQMGIQSGLGSLQLIIPLGLSYYVLQNISYLIDVYRGQTPASTNLVDFALYLAYFPKMVAGPIERARTFLPILARSRHVDNQTFSRNLILILMGLTRKLLIANLLFAYTPWRELTSDPSVFSKLELMGWLIIYAFALYNDFAGYTNIVRGVSGLFGIELSSNFNVPYFSKTFTEFWTRWHITLSQWLRDYIFFPLSRFLARRVPERTAWQNLIIPPLITMLISGIWHKPNWQMLLWGGMHGSYLVIERYLILWRPNWFQNRKGGATSLLYTAAVFLMVVLAWAPFSMGIQPALNFWKQLWHGNAIGLMDYKLIYSLFILIPAIYFDWIQSQRGDEFFLLQRGEIVQALLIATLIFLILIVTNSGPGQPFIYQGF